MSDCGASNNRFASSDTNFTDRSGPGRTQATPEATRTSTTLVIAGDTDSTRNGTTGAFGNGSTAAAGAALEALFGGGVVFFAGGSGGRLNAGMATVFVVWDRVFFGGSHFSHKIPVEISRPHMKHLEAMRRFRTADVTRVPAVSQREIDSGRFATRSTSS